MNFIEDDGYIEYQSRCDLPYGKFKSSRNGCGWIAFYNFYRTIYGQQTAEDSLETIRKRFDATVNFWGIFGTSIFDMAVHLRRQYNNRTVKVRRRLMKSHYSGNLPRYGIIYYFTGHSLHYVAFERNGREFIFHNVESKITTKSMDEFEDKYIKFKHYLLFELEEI